MLKLRYYYQVQGNKEVVNLLAEIEVKHKIPFELSDLSRHGAYDMEEEKRVYERDFKPRARILKKRTGRSVRKELRGGKGKKRYYVSIPGTIAVVRDEKIEWYTLGDEEILGFLEEVFSKGYTFLEDVVAEKGVISG